VHAAGGLSIDSPLYTPGTAEGVNPFTGDVAVSESGSMAEDVDMVRLVLIFLPAHVSTSTRLSPQD
jgi:hypothetical protein